jgi:hypothetical protein
MELNEAIKILQENNYIVESLTANVEKLYAMFDRHLKRLGYYEEPWRTARHYIIGGRGRNKDNRFVVYKNEKITKDPEVMDSLKDSCERCGFYCNTEAFDRIIITPKNQKKVAKVSPDQVFYHVSKSPTIDKTGLRIRDRMKDDMFDIYEGRIYLSTVKSTRLRDLIVMVLREHRMRASEINLYEVKVPPTYEIYRDPTLNTAVYVTNSIPAKYIKKLNVRDYITPRIFNRLDKPLNFINDKDFGFDLYLILNDYLDKEGYGPIERSKIIDNLVKDNSEYIQNLYLNDKTAHTIAKELVNIFLG